eukprot:Seg5277.3 transcript_id=Seg5277.3/GoldUCD/mRNA.D3Y31 product="hypothetical protein" protein_id=Seg5277.3/GoldUCD/D3Y31
MGVDRRGKKRKRCLQAACDCEEYELPKEGNNCDYCGCKPTKHELVQEREAALDQQEAPHCKRRKINIAFQDDVFDDLVSAVSIDETPCVQEENELFKMIEEIQPLSPCTPEEV